MRNRFVKKIVSVLSCAVVSALFIVTLFFSAPKIAQTPETTGELTYTVYDHASGPQNVTVEMGRDVTAVRISDLNKLGKITKANYVADRFVHPGSLSEPMQIVDLTKPFEFAEKGTLVFLILNIDPLAEDFAEQTEKLNDYKTGDYWHFTFSLPEIFCAANVYRKADLVARHGEIENYDFIDFNTSYDKRTEKLSAQTAATYLDLQFYTRRQTMADPLAAAQVITVHYQSAGGSYAGLKDTPLIGTEDAVKRIYDMSQNVLLAFTILAAVVFAVLVVLSALEHTHEFLPAIVWIGAITVLLLCRFFLSGVTSLPLFWSALALAMPFFVLVGAQLAVGKNLGKIPAQYIFPAFASVGALLAFLCPYVPFGAANVLQTVCTVLKGIGAVALAAFIGWAISRKNDPHTILQMTCTSLIAVAVFASLFMPQVFPAYVNPLFWLCIAVTVTTFVGVFIIFKETKKSNVYLTANLHKEVERQIKDIKSVIDERDRLLQFVSHDMKKPLVTSASLLDTLTEREKDGEQIKTLQIVKQNTARVINNLSEIAAYAKFNYIAEPSQIVDLSELCNALYEFHHPDCNANGIVLKNLTEKSVKAFVKKQGLENVISNIIINAVEHANCKTITLSAKADKNKIVLSVADDGKGIDANIDIFKPYVSENGSETGGVGLYICKSVIESMNGELTYSSKPGNTVFRISLLKA